MSKEIPISPVAARRKEVTPGRDFYVEGVGFGRVSAVPFDVGGAKSVTVFEGKEDKEFKTAHGGLVVAEELMQDDTAQGVVRKAIESAIGPIDN